MAWTEEKFEMAKKLAAEGMSATEMATRINAAFPLSKPMSRSAVLGKLFRNNVDKRVTHRTRSDTKPRKRSKPRGEFRLFHQMGLINTNAPKRIPVDGFVPPVEAPAPEHQRKTLLELEDNHCRWPIGDPLKADEFHFCGAEAVPGLPYCDGHCRKSYITPVRKVQRDYAVDREVFETEDA